MSVVQPSPPTAAPSGHPEVPPQLIELDPLSMGAVYRRWARRDPVSRAEGSEEKAFRAQVARLRALVTSDAPVLQPTSLPLLVVPRPDAESKAVQAARAELWRRQTLFNEGVRDVVNYWPRHSRSPAGLCWLKDEVAPHVAAFPFPGRGHRSSLLVAATLRAAKTVVTTALAVAQRPALARLQRGNRHLYDALVALASPQTPARPELEALAARLLEVAAWEVGADVDALSVHAQQAFQRDAARAVAALLLPGEALLEVEYQAWLARRGALPPPSERDRAAFSVVVLDGAPQVVARLSPLVADGRCDGVPRAAVPRLVGALEGEWVVLAQGDVQVEPGALRAVLAEARRHPEVVLWYADHDREVTEGVFTRPFFKPGWSPDLFLEVDYVGGVVFVRREVLEAWARQGGAGGVPGLVLACHAGRQRLGRVAQVLWHERAAVVEPSGHRAAVQTHLAAVAPGAELRATAQGHRVVYPVPGTPKVSIIVPFKDKPELLEQLLTTLLAHEPYPNFELLLVSNNSRNPATFRFLSALTDPRLRVVEWNHPFNYQALNNAAVKQWATGEVLLFLNNDVSWGEGGALAEMLGHALRPDIGAVGVNLRYPDGRLQHAGVVVGLAGFAAHPFSGVWPDARWTAYGLPSWTRNYQAVTAACLMVRRAVFDEVGGFDEEFVVSGGDVDLCLRIGARGYRHVNTPHVQLTHHESATRAGSVIPDSDAWHGYAAFARFIRGGDPTYNPNLTLTSQDCLPRRDGRSAEALAMQLLATMLPDSRQVSGQTKGAA